MRLVLAASIGLVGLALVAGCSGESESRGDVSVDRFNADRAWNLVEEQVGVGQRPAGSPQLRQLAVRLRGMLPNAEFEPVPGEPGLRNVVGTLPGVTPGIVVGAHYDTLVRPRGVVGANNGAAGTAAVIEIARALGDSPPSGQAREIRFVIFDGEQLPTGLPTADTDFYWEGLRGSRAYVDAQPGRTKQMVLLDYVAGRDLHLPREANSSELLWSRLLNASAAVGKSEPFSADTGPAIIDDHLPFARAGSEVINLIDWSYPGHSRADTMDRLSPESLDAVGETVTQLIMELREE